MYYVLYSVMTKNQRFVRSFKYFCDVHG